MRSVRWLEAIWMTATPAEGTWIFLEGASMEPAYADGDWLLVRPLAGASPLSPGEVVVARRGDRLVTHRLVELREGMAITKGDACSSVDPPVPIGALLGRVVAARRGASRFLVYRLARRLMQRISTASKGGRNERI
jgi:hypothetical protein